MHGLVTISTYLNGETKPIDLFAVIFENLKGKELVFLMVVGQVAV